MQNLKKISSIHDLSSFFGYKREELDEFLFGKKDSEKYVDFRIAKRKGGSRVLRSPKAEAKTLQKILLVNLEPLYSPPSCVFSYVKGRGIKENAEKHLMKDWLFKIDLLDFFPSIHFGRVRGLFMEKPFNFSLPVAQRLATLVTADGVLPQGAPTSPIISNFIMYGLDKEILKHSKNHGITYTRYADDMVFSCSGDSFPAEFGSIHYHDDGTPYSKTGPLLESVLRKHKFSINQEKVYLTHMAANKRGIVNGIVVNKRLTLKRSYARELRSIIYIWERYGIDDAIKSFAEYDKKNRSPRNEDITKQKFEQIILAKIVYLGRIRGFDDHKFNKLWRRATNQIKYITPKKPQPKKDEDILNCYIYVEGVTDENFINFALNKLKDQGRFLNINPEVRALDSDNNLLKHCEDLRKQKHKKPLFFIFDRDNEGMLNKITPTFGSIKDWGNKVFSFALPVPTNRKDYEKICIEHYFEDQVIKSEIDGRRLFEFYEFDNLGIHKENNNLVKQNPNKKTLILDDHILDIDQRKKVSLSKSHFSKAVKEGEAPFKDVNVENFSLIFDLIDGVLKKLNS